MKKKVFNALGLMSGTSMDGVDLSLIKSDGISDFTSILNNFYEFDNDLRSKLIDLRDQLNSTMDLEKYSYDLKKLEREITLFYAELLNDFMKSQNYNIDLVGLHGQTIYHNVEKKISLQLGDGKLLSQLSQKIVINDFRKNDLDNGGQGAPLVPIFHNVIANKINKEFNLEFPINFLNIGGIANITTTANWKDLWNKKKIYAYDVGPGNCLMDQWLRNNTSKKYDKEGLIARSGNTDKSIFNQAVDNFILKPNYEKSLDVKDFDISFAKGLSLENGLSTITDFTAKLIADGISYSQEKIKSKMSYWLVCGGGRKNKYLLETIKKNFREINLDPIEKYKMNGDFIESQAFAFLSIRSLEKMPITFPSTTRCNEPITGGVIAEVI